MSAFRPASRFTMALDEIIERDAARNWSERDAWLALRPTCGDCFNYRGCVVPMCQAFNTYTTAGESALGCSMFEPDLRDDGPDDDEIGDGDVGSAGRGAP